VRVFRQISTLEDAIGSHASSLSHACSLEANMRVTNGIPLGKFTLLPVDTVNCVATLKAQLRGRKQWRFIGPDVGAVRRHVEEATPDGVGGGASAAQPSVPAGAGGAGGGGGAGAGAGAVGFEVTLEVGDIVVWGPGWTHGTAALEGESVALSMEFASPRPIALLNEHRALFEAHSNQFRSWSHCGWW
jgi:hypothetical protein